MSSRSNLAESALQARVRDKLNNENVKLWQEPFFDENLKTINDVEIMALASRYSTETEASESEVMDCLLSLQRNALDRLAERDLYKETGMATVRLKLSGFPSTSNDDTTGGKDRIQINLPQMTGKDFKKEIADMIPCSENLLKLICQGRVLDENKMLVDQNIKNGSQVMVLLLPMEQGTYQESEDNLRQLEETRDSANYLAGQSNSAYSLQVADQTGKALDLPEAEKKSLAVALALHEKGRSAMKALEFSKALVWLLEADSQYKISGFFHDERGVFVDNYGLLNLDIAWTYLSLQSIGELPAVDARLQQCEKSLQRSYGENMERVIALKGSTGWEAALFVRLHLLQGIVAYHQGHVERAKYLIGKVDEELRRLHVSDDQLCELINMGYGSDESRMALRATYGNAAAAVDWIIRKREEKDEIRRQEKEDLRRKKLERKLGNCDNGDPVNVQLWRTLKEMGFNALLASSALKRTNNDVDAALQLINDDEFILQVVSNIKSHEGSSSSNPEALNTVEQIAASVAAAAANLRDSGNVPGPSSSMTSNSGLMNELAQMANFLLSEELSEEHVSVEQAQKSQKAYDALAKDMCSEADYIDLTLSSEHAYITQYKDLLRM